MQPHFQINTPAVATMSNTDYFSLKIYIDSSLPDHLDIFYEGDSNIKNVISTLNLDTTPSYISTNPIVFA